MNPGIVIKKSNLSCDQRTGHQYYAHTDQGIIYGSTYRIVKNKVERAGAGPWVLPKDEPRHIDPEHEHDVHFSGEELEG